MGPTAEERLGGRDGGLGEGGVGVDRLGRMGCVQIIPRERHAVDQGGGPARAAAAAGGS